MNKLIKNIENFNVLKKIHIKNEKMIIETFLMNNCIDNIALRDQKPSRGAGWAMFFYESS